MKKTKYWRNLYIFWWGYIEYETPRFLIAHSKFVMVHWYRMLCRQIYPNKANVSAIEEEIYCNKVGQSMNEVAALDIFIYLSIDTATCSQIHHYQKPRVSNFAVDFWNVVQQSCGSVWTSSQRYVRVTGLDFWQSIRTLLCIQLQWIFEWIPR